MQRVRYEAEQFRLREGRWPSPPELRAAVPDLPASDPWRRALVVTAEHDGFVAASAGLDGLPNTADDIRSTPMRSFGER